MYLVDSYGGFLLPCASVSMAESLFLEFFGAKEHSPDSTSVYYGDEIFKAFKAKHEKNRVTEKEES